MSQPQYIDEELCPSCGEFVESLIEDTGWCGPCSGITPSTHCRRCSQPLGANNGLCGSCKYELWLITNADAIDRTMATYCIGATEAKRVVLRSNRPICRSCNNPIKGGTKGRHIFCTKTAKCRKAQNAYRYYYNYKRLSQDEAISKALEAATIFSLLDRLTTK